MCQPQASPEMPCRNMGTETHLDQDQFMQEHSPPHIRNCDARHNEQPADHKPFRPSFENEILVRGMSTPIAGLARGDRAYAPMEDECWSH